MKLLTDKDIGKFIGSVYERLTVVSALRKYSSGTIRWFFHCRCSCGKEKDIYKSSIIGGLTRSCGCLLEETRIVTGSKATKTHGDASRQKGVAPEYDTYRSVLKRCYNPSQKHYKNYGGRGISVCQRWLDGYENFLADVGRKPGPRYSLDRINNNGDYEPGNVHWATPKQQGRNRRTNRKVQHNGETLCISEWAEKTGIPKATVGRVLIEDGPPWML